MKIKEWLAQQNDKSMVCGDRTAGSLGIVYPLRDMCSNGWQTASDGRPVGYMEMCGESRKSNYKPSLHIFVSDWSLGQRRSHGRNMTGMFTGGWEWQAGLKLGRFNANRVGRRVPELVPIWRHSHARSQDVCTLVVVVYPEPYAIYCQLQVFIFSIGVLYIVFVRVFTARAITAPCELWAFFRKHRCEYLPQRIRIFTTSCRTESPVALDMPHSTIYGRYVDT